jgi:hypothetical protein
LSVRSADGRSSGHGSRRGRLRLGAASAPGERQIDVRRVIWLLVGSGRMAGVSGFRHMVFRGPVRRSVLDDADTGRGARESTAQRVAVLNELCSMSQRPRFRARTDGLPRAEIGVAWRRRVRRKADRGGIALLYVAAQVVGCRCLRGCGRRDDSGGRCDRCESGDGAMCVHGCSWRSRWDRLGCSPVPGGW